MDFYIYGLNKLDNAASSKEGKEDSTPSQELIHNMIMKQIDSDSNLLSYLQERSQSQNNISTMSQNRANRCSSAVSRLHSKHLLGKGYSEIISKITEEQERIKKIHRNRKFAFGKNFLGVKHNLGKKKFIDKGTSFSSNNSSIQDFTFKKKIADDISQMIIDNLKNYQKGNIYGGSFSMPKGNFKYKSKSRSRKHRRNKTRILKRDRPSLDNYFISLRRKSKDFSSDNYEIIYCPNSRNINNLDIERQIGQRTSVNPTQNYTSSIDLKIDTSPMSSQINSKSKEISQINRDSSFFDLSQQAQSLGEENEKPTIKINGDVIFKKAINEGKHFKKLFPNNS